MLITWDGPFVREHVPAPKMIDSRSEKFLINKNAINVKYLGRLISERT